jgi:hypothetical protein
MIKFELNTYIYRPLMQVFAFVATPENDFHWQYGTLISTKISKGKMSLGTLFRVVGYFMGQRIQSVYEVIDFEPNKRYGFKSLSGPMDSYTLYTFEVTNGSTRINLTTQISPCALLKPNDITTERKVKKQYRENLALLKDVLETSPVNRPSESTSPVSNRRWSDFS